MYRSARLPLLLGMVVAAAAGCADAPPPTPRPPASASIAASVIPSATSAPTPVETPAASEPISGDLRIEEIENGVTGPFLEVVSDGQAIWFSGIDPEKVEDDAAPVLYRILPDTRRRELIWRSEDPAYSIVRIRGHYGMVAFSELDITPGHRAWNFWLLPDAEPGAEPILLDTFPGGDEVPGFVPSADVNEGRVVWTAFDDGKSGPVSQLWLASGPDWTPRLLATRNAAERELWLPSLRLNQLAFTEVIYNEDRTSDERHVLLMDLDHPEQPPRRLDTSGRATMPVVVADGVIWKQAGKGMNMFNWGGLHHHTFADGQERVIDLTGDQVNYPSGGDRFLAAHSIDLSILKVYDLERGEAVWVERHPPAGPGAAARPSLTGSLLVWVGLTLDESAPGPPPTIRWTYLPPAGGATRGFP